MDGADPRCMGSAISRRDRSEQAGQTTPTCAFGASQTFKSNVCASPRPPSLRFHRHSRFVPRILALRFVDFPGRRRPRLVGSAISRRDRVGASWTNLTDLRLRRIADVQKQRLRQPPAFRSFVFIDILALFPEKPLSAVGSQLHMWVGAEPRLVGSAISRRDRSEQAGQTTPTCASGASQTFKSNVCASPRPIDPLFS